MSMSSRLSIAAFVATLSIAGRARADLCRTEEVATFFKQHGFDTKSLELTSWSPGAGQSGATFCRAIVGGKLFAVKYYPSGQACEAEHAGYRDAISDQALIMLARDDNSGYPATGATEVPGFVRQMFAPYLGKGPDGGCAFTVSAMAPGARVSDLVADPATGLRTARALGTYLGLLHRKTASLTPGTERLDLANWIAIGPPDASFTNVLYSELDGVFIVDWARRGTGTRTIADVLRSVFNQLGTAAVPVPTAFVPTNITQRTAVIEALRVASGFWESYLEQLNRSVDDSTLSIPMTDAVWSGLQSALVRFKHQPRTGDPLQAVCQTYVATACGPQKVDPDLCGECARYLD